LNFSLNPTRRWSDDTPANWNALGWGHLLASAVVGRLCQRRDIPWLSPMIASVAMTLSSLSVLLNALRLRGFEPGK
jgi:cation transport ATPase